MDYHAHLFSLFSKENWEESISPFLQYYCECEQKQLLSIAVNQKFMLQMHFNSISAYILEQFLFYVDTWKAYYLCLNIKVRVRPRLMLFETGSATSADHHHRAVLSLPLQHSWLLCSGLSSLHCRTSGIMNWMVKTHSMQDPLLPTTGARGFIISCREVTEWLVTDAIPLESLNGVTVLVFF